MYSSSSRPEKMHAVTRHYSFNESVRLELRRERKEVARKTYKHRNQRREMKWESTLE